MMELPGRSKILCEKQNRRHYFGPWGANYWTLGTWAEQGVDWAGQKFFCSQVGCVVENFLSTSPSCSPLRKSIHSVLRALISLSASVLQELAESKKDREVHLSENRTLWTVFPFGQIQPPNSKNQPAITLCSAQPSELTGPDLAPVLIPIIRRQHWDLPWGRTVAFCQELVKKY